MLRKVAPGVATNYTHSLSLKNEGPSLLAADSEEELSSDEASDMEDNRPSLLLLNVSFATALQLCIRMIMCFPTAVDVEGSSLTVCCNLE